MKNLDPNSEKFKNYEKETETTLNPEQPIIVRLDGKALTTVANFVNITHMI